MVLINKIYTRTGDAGDTGLVNGQRVAKSDPRVEAYGEVDELNAVIGLARLQTAGSQDLDALLARIQNDLFDLGADLATPDLDPAYGPPLRIVETQVTRLEGEIDGLNAQLQPLTSFILPGGTPAAAALHLARTVCRRAERRAVAFAEANGGAGPHAAAIRYLNRLSDLLFTAARVANLGQGGDGLWVPAANR